MNLLQPPYAVSWVSEEEPGRRGRLGSTTNQGLRSWSRWAETQVAYRTRSSRTRSLGTHERMNAFEVALRWLVARRTTVQGRRCWCGSKNLRSSGHRGKAENQLAPVTGDIHVA